MQASLELAILLPQPLEGWDHRCGCRLGLAWKSLGSPVPGTCCTHLREVPEGRPAGFQLPLPQLASGSAQGV